jgi:hypothetical protein
MTPFDERGLPVDFIRCELWRAPQARLAAIGLDPQNESAR